MRRVEWHEEATGRVPLDAWGRTRRGRVGSGAVGSGQARMHQVVREVNSGQGECQTDTRAGSSRAASTRVSARRTRLTALVTSALGRGACGACGACEPDETAASVGGGGGQRPQPAHTCLTRDTCRRPGVV